MSSEVPKRQLGCMRGDWDRVFALIPNHGSDSYPELVNRVVAALREPSFVSR